MDSITYIDLNADVGEGVSTEAQIMPLISSCNVACGGHYGDRESTMKTLRLAQQHGVKVGAHPGYPDKANFGRVVMDISSQELYSSIRDQLKLFKSCCEELNLKINHIKPHGALYNEAGRNQEVANTVVAAIADSGYNVPVYTQYIMLVLTASENGIPTIKEAFVDRRYNGNYSLVSRKKKGSVINDPQAAWKQLSGFLFEGGITDYQGFHLSFTVLPKTYCVHGDTPNALKILQYIHTQLAANHIQLKR